MKHVLTAAGEPFGDLHLHTHHSDGLDSPEKVVQRAAALGMSYLAVTDHDTIRAVPVAAESAKELGIRFVPGVELSATTEGGDVHLLGYFVDVEDEEFRETLSIVENKRRERVLCMIEKLRGLGVKAFPERYFARYSRGFTGRLSLATYLVDEGLVPSKAVVFSKYLGRECPAYEPVDALTTAEALRVLRKAGGVTVLAHPGRSGIDHLISQLIEEGLHGIEAYHSSHNEVDAIGYKSLAEASGLLVTGGSDCHGREEPAPLMGTVRVPMSFVDALREKATELLQDKV
jgi:predicted metal-dependent phosphoesterase TrpH